MNVSLTDNIKYECSMYEIFAIFEEKVLLDHRRPRLNTKREE